MSIKHAILGLLAERPLHGYELKAAYEAELVPAAQLNIGQVYTTLDRLTRDGLVAHEVVSQTERPDKKVYALTPTGLDEVRTWMATATRLDLDLRNEVFLKLILARRLGEADPLDVLRVERQACFARLREVTQARAEARKQAAPVPTLLLLDLAIVRLEAFIQWLDHSEEVLKKESNR